MIKKNIYQKIFYFFQKTVCRGVVDTSCELDNSALLRDGIFQTYGPKNRVKESTGENHVEAGNTTKLFANCLEKLQDAQQEVLGCWL